MMIDANGFAQGAVLIPSPFFDERPEGVLPKLVVIHCISLPRGQYLNGNVKALFTGTIDTSADPSFASLEGLHVSSHFFIDREGTLFQFVSTKSRAWHAGVSFFKGKTGCNDFSIGIELEGVDDDVFTSEQYARLHELLEAIRNAHDSVRYVTGHSDIAPGRKTDPGTGFDWGRVALSGLEICRN
ncbi:MAG TPA: 1,6-anhydro-N-acetylmuramyl-L-alanine amidase AmpD [Sutterella sp.]|nr:1,6-anhydro-N-acetylmuramyl-L-alanine amidase AmpD [Sutterella sp.]